MTAPSDKRAALAEITAHHRQFGPLYGGFLSDHLPMAALARIGLGDEPANVIDYIGRYQRRLSAIGDQPEYKALLDRYLAAIERDGIAATLSNHLPRLISGWVRDAYHPIIRIAYGIEFGIAQEVAAGLAYFDCGWVGADPRLAEVAASATNSGTTPETLFTRAQHWQPDLEGAGTFSQCAQRVIDSGKFAEAALVLSDNLRGMSRVALNVFSATHNFFALHLVTASHAFRLLYDYAGPHADAIFNLGLVAGYAAVGAPEFDTLRSSPLQANQSMLSLCAEDEHDFKLAYSATRQASFFDDPGYLEVAKAYLTRRTIQGND
jgi:hypothetical protein